MTQAAHRDSRGPSAREVFEAIARRIEAGENLGMYAQKMAEDVLGRKILRGGAHCRRPDAADRAANDLDHRAGDDDEQMVVL